jgi:CO/xanthine dehydrogenase FAD-binding subunit
VEPFLYVEKYGKIEVNNRSVESQTESNNLWRDTMVEIINQGFDGGKRSLRLGVSDTLQTVYEVPDCPALLRSVLGGAVAWQKRNEFKVGVALRSLTQWAAVLMSLGARVTAEGKDELLADFLGQGGAIGKLTEVRVPLDVRGRVYGESAVRRTPSDTPIVAAFAVVDLTDGVVKQARLALTGVWEENVRLAKAAEKLIGRSLDGDTIAEVAASAQQEVNPKDHYLGSAEYRRAMTAVITKRALQSCVKGEMQA